MANIVIFSDGTGQRGGLMFDERRSNVYKLFRATRCGPDSCVNPRDQVTFYDPGLGTVPAGHSFGVVGAVARSVYNLASQATGLGMTHNIVDCYAAIIRLWHPGDRIFLFGFSRGAYTMRCLSAVLGMCGVPTQDERGKPLLRDENSTNRIASEGVRKVYQHTESRKTFTTPRQKELSTQRDELARRFRDTYGAGVQGDETRANAYPYFIGLFDTVAALVNPLAVATLFWGVVFPLLILGFATAPFTPHVWHALVAMLVVTVAIFFVGLLKSLVRSEWSLPRTKNWRPFHLIDTHIEQYETDLSTEVTYARHAISIDEHRKSFDRVLWGGAYSDQKTVDGWFEQRWFSGNHSDIGGSYPENESRLSDISLEWMLDAATAAGLIHDPSVLHLYPDPLGPQHDETKTSLVFRSAPKLNRTIRPDAPLHSVRLSSICC